ncbi:hypothetical protein PHMEG_0009873 [Phytophthora megakarya]|uniref:Reverse transcriptase domain-containing protein n=1 Tax=Phytophthora megakarya TaxID=4795 RepID=A0A225WF46_9STRA|nr:hypothetical protein PHMEG_0009873 [Phytophthora megakarya]
MIVEGLPELYATILVARTLCTVQSGKRLVEFCNASTEDVVIRKGTTVVVATQVPDSAFKYEYNAPMSEATDEIINPATVVENDNFTFAPDSDTTLQEELEMDFDGFKWSTKQQKLLNDLLYHISMTPGRTYLLEFSIDTGNTSPIKQRPYRVSKAEGDGMERELQLVDTRKPDGGIRFCIDYRRRNAVTVQNGYPMPLIDDILDVLGNTKLFSTMDIPSGYWKVPMAADIVENTAFACKYGLYEWLVMTFGLCSTVPAFERLMENVLIDLKWRSCLVYFADCVVFSCYFPSHILRLRQVLGHFLDAGFKLKMKNVRHIVTLSGILPNPEKVKAVVNVKRPHGLHTVRAFLGLTNYFRRYIPGYAGISAPIERFNQKDTEFVWTDDCERRLIEPTILVYPDISKRFKLFVDSSKLAVGACLMQTITVVTEWQEFDLYTDHKALTWVFKENNRTSNAKRARW